ncbi:putative membrane protein [Thermoplasmatales archaeon SCGC AB-539-C06]|nr:putative membrane protein [Thermoplasmatales archaeon SCGC AB-539-C06]
MFSFAFLPPIIYAIWIRNIERYNREKWKPIILCFLWGATIAIVASIILELILGISLAISFEDGNILGLVTAIIIAPFAEELTKPIALRTKTVKKELTELEDGLIYGAVAGLGFSATENLLYGWCFLSEGLFVFLVLIIIRSFGGCLLHASATALTGYGYGKTIIRGKSILRVLPFFILAILVHTFYNFLVSLDIVGLVISLFAALIFVAISIRLVRDKIKSLDTSNR